MTSFQGKDYEQLPQEIVGEIVARLDITDRVRMGSVSKYWRSIATRKDIKAVYPQTPWMVVPCINSASKQIGLFNINQGRTHNFKLPETIQQGWCCGSSKGWLAIVSDVYYNNAPGAKTAAPQIFLFDPISEVCIELPPIERFISRCSYFRPRDFAVFMKKIELSSEDASTCTIAALFERGWVLAICQADDKEWTIFQKDKRRYCRDISFSNNGVLNVLYGPSRRDEVVNQNFILKLPKHEINIQLILDLFPVEAEPENNGIDTDIGLAPEILTNSYLVESNGELLLVHRLQQIRRTCYPHKVDSFPETTRFEVFKIHDTDFHFQRVNSLDDRTLWVGKGCCSVFLPTGTERFHGFDKNCIYFLKDEHYYVILSNFGVGVFFLGNGSVIRYFSGSKFPVQRCLFWFTPRMSYQEA